MNFSIEIITEGDTQSILMDKAVFLYDEAVKKINCHKEKFSMKFNHISMGIARELGLVYTPERDRLGAIFTNGCIDAKSIN